MNGAPSVRGEAIMNVSNAISTALNVINEVSLPEDMEATTNCKRKFQEVDGLSPNAKFEDNGEPVRRQLLEESTSPAVLESTNMNENIEKVIQEDPNDKVRKRPAPYLAYQNNFYEYSDEGPFFLYVEITSEKGRIHPMFVGKLIRTSSIDIYKNILSIKKIDRFSLKIEMNNYHSANVLKIQKYWQENNLVCFIPNFLIHKQGVIRDVEYSLTDEELLDFIVSDKNVIKARRIYKMVNGLRVPTPVAILTFRSQCIPKEVKILEVLCRVEPYIQNVTQCRGCYKFGHFLARCSTSSTPTCPGCRGLHEYKDCPQSGVVPVCINCKGGHLASDKNCPEFLKQKKMKEVMNDRNLSFKEALFIVNEKSSFAKKTAVNNVIEASQAYSAIVKNNQNFIYHPNNEKTSRPTIKHKKITVRSSPYTPIKESPHFEIQRNISNNLNPEVPIINNMNYKKNIDHPEKFKIVLNSIIKRISSSEFPTSSSEFLPEDVEYFIREIKNNINI